MTHQMHTQKGNTYKNVFDLFQCCAVRVFNSPQVTVYPQMICHIAGFKINDSSCIITGNAPSRE